MAGMLQNITYMLAFYLVIKGIQILQIGLASSRENRTGLIVIGVVTLVFCAMGAWGFVTMQDEQAQAVRQLRPIVRE